MCTQHKRFAHLTQEDRFRIEALFDEKYSCRKIAQRTKIGASVISREIARNQEKDGSYCAIKAHEKASMRRGASKQAARKIERDPGLAQEIEDALRGDDTERGDWSPEVIANVTCKGRISHTTIYAWIKRERSDLRCLLPHQGHRRKKYGAKTEHGTIQTTNPRSIDNRPPEVATREELGHYEGDTIVLREGRIHTLVERASRFLIADLLKVAGMGLAMQVSESAVRGLSPLSSARRLTITYDRGSEFAWWDETEKELPGLCIYFAHAHSPWERGTNERINGLLRRYFPKGQTFAMLTHDDVAKVVWRLNHRPRKILHWRTPCEVFGECCSSSVN